MNTEITKTCLNLKCLVGQGIDALTAAGRLLLEMLDGGASFPDISEQSGIPMDVLGQLERIGRHQLNPHLLLATYPAVQAIQRLSLSEQDRLLSEPVAVMVMKDGHPDTLMIAAKNMTREQVGQVFAKGHVRTLAEQRAWLETRGQKSIPPKLQDVPYTITRRHTVVFNACVELTAKELFRIAQALQD
jgi:hypothetical protein